MKFKFAMCAIVAALAVAALPALAHHSFAAEYDNSKPVSIKGKAIKMDWVNPHSHLTLEVTAPDGKTEVWAAETPPPNGLYRAGWRQNMIKGGEEITVNGYLAKDGTRLMWAQSVDFADGRRITLNSSPEPQTKGGAKGGEKE
jgi:lipopolysaccharide export system protein LptA